jgi:hypothetical protein
MAQLDVSDVLLDPLFCDPLRVLRRVENINNFGENSFFVTYPGPAFGIITPVAPNELERMPDAQIDKKTIRVITNFRLQLATPGYQADAILWHKDTYVVISVSDWTGYGGGFVEAIAQSMDLIQASIESQPQWSAQATPGGGAQTVPGGGFPASPPAVLPPVEFGTLTSRVLANGTSDGQSVLIIDNLGLASPTNPLTLSGTFNVGNSIILTQPGQGVLAVWSGAVWDVPSFLIG